MTVERCHLCGCNQWEQSCTSSTFSPGSHPWRRIQTAASKICYRNKQLGDNNQNSNTSRAGGSRSSTPASLRPIRRLLPGSCVGQPGVPIETKEHYTLNTGGVDVYAFYPWRRQSKRHLSLLLLASPPSLCARGGGASPSRVASWAGGLVGGACCHDCRGCCCCLEL